MRSTHASGVLTATVLCAAGIGSTTAAASVFTNYADFLLETTGYSNVASLTFDDLSVEAFASGSTLHGVTFNEHDDSTGQLAVATGYATTSGANYLGINNDDGLLNGRYDNFGLSFASSNAISLFIIATAADLWNGDIQLTAGGETTSLNTSAVYKTWDDGSAAFFLGLTSDTAFTSATLSNAAADFFYNIDDITLAAAPLPPPPPNEAPVPNPLLAGVLAWWGFGTWQRRRTQRARHVVTTNC